MPFIDGSSGTTTAASVDSNYNLQINTPYTLYSGTGISAVTSVIGGGESKSGFVSIIIETNPGVVTGSRTMITPKVSYDNRVRFGVDTPLFIDRFAGHLGGINTALYAQTGNSLPANSIGGGFLQVNTFSASSSGTWATIGTRRSFPVNAPFGVKYNAYAGITSYPSPGTVTEWGLMIATGTTTPSDGAFFRYSGTGVYAVTNNSGIENIVSGIDQTLIGTGNAGTVGGGSTHKFTIDLNQNDAVFRIDNNIVATAAYPIGATGSSVGYDAATASSSLPICYRVYVNTTGVFNTQSIWVAAHSVTQNDANNLKTWPSIQAGQGAMASQGQNQTPMGSTSNYVNVTNPVYGTGLNTTALLGSGIGGNFVWSGTINCNNSSGALNPDYIICDYVVPSGFSGPLSATPGKSLYIHGVNISAFNLQPSGVWTGTVTSAMGLAYGHTSESLATTESASSKAPRFVPLGTIPFPSGAPAGYTGSTPYYNPQPLVFPFMAPIVVNPSEYFAITSRFIGSSGLMGIMQYNIGIDGYWE